MGTKPEHYARMKLNNVHYNLVMPIEMNQELHAVAVRGSTTVAELIRTYIEWGLENGYKPNGNKG